MKSNSKLYLLVLCIGFLAPFLLRGLTWAMLYVWTKNYPQVVGTCSGHHGQLISQNCVLTKIRAEPPPLRRQVHLSSYMFKILNGQSPSNFINKFKFISGGSRDGANCNLYTPKSKNLKKFYYLGAKAWNCLPSDLRNLTDPKVFSRNFKNRLLDSVVSDPNYIVNNAYDYIYKVKILN